MGSDKDLIDEAKEAYYRKVASRDARNEMRYARFRAKLARRLAKALRRGEREVVAYVPSFISYYRIGSELNCTGRILYGLPIYRWAIRGILRFINDDNDLDVIKFTADV